MSAPIGRVVATELKPSTPHQFYFWTATESDVGIGAIVRVDHPGRTVYGVVTDGMAYADLASPLHAVIGAEGDPSVVAGRLAYDVMEWWVGAGSLAFPLADPPVGSRRSMPDD